MTRTAVVTGASSGIGKATAADSARFELSPFGVWVSTVEPGAIRTGISARRTTYIADGSPYVPDFQTMLARLDHNESTGTRPEKVARTIMRAVEASRPKPLYAMGSKAPLVFTLRRLLPGEAVLKRVARAHGLRR